MDTNLLAVVALIGVALIFDFINGFHDAANSIATVVSTRVLSPGKAVLWAATFNFVAAFAFGTAVAKTVGSGLVDVKIVTFSVIFAGLIGAIVWNMVTWLLGLPSSSSHALFGGLIGAAIVGFGTSAIDFSVVMSKVILPAILAPLTAGLIAYAATKLAYAITRRNDGKPDGRDGFRHAQIFSSSLVALAHGTNDAQKTMGIITLTLVSAGLQPVGSDVQTWVIVTCAIAIALGTYMGGWRIIKTLGTGLTDIKPAQGFAAETATAATILASTNVGFALSTTQVASGSVIGSGLGRRGSKVRWRTAGRIGIGWLLTLPASAAVGALAAMVAHLGVIGVLIDAVVGVVVIVGIFVWSRRSEVTPDNVVSEVADSGRAVKIKRNPKPKQRVKS